MRATEGGLALSSATGPALNIRPRSAIEKSTSAPVPKKRRVTSKEGLAMTGKEHVLVDAEARAKPFREREMSDLDSAPWEIEIHVTVNGYSNPSCWGAHQIQVSTSHVWLFGSKGFKTPKDRRTFRAQDLGQRNDAPTEDDFEEDYELYSKSTAMRPTNPTAERTLTTMPGETKTTSSCAS